MSNTLKITIKVSNDLSIVHPDYLKSRTRELEILCESPTPNDAVADAIRNLSVLADSWSQQRLAEHCNCMILSHSAFVRNKNIKSFDLNYPHLRITVKPV